MSIPADLPPLPPDQYPRMWGMSAYLRPDYRGYFEQTNDREPMCNVLHVVLSHYYVGGRKIWYQAGDTRPIRSDIRLYDMHEARSEALGFGVEEWMMQTGLFDDRPRSREITYIWMAFRTARALSDLKMHSNEYTLEEGRKKFAELLFLNFKKVSSFYLIATNSQPQMLFLLKPMHQNQVLYLFL